MAKLIILRGISGSGKSTWTAAYKNNHPEDKVIVVNRDSIRALLFGTEDAYGVDEELVTQVERPMFVAALMAGYTVISDNTNIRTDFLNEMLEWTPGGTEVEVVMMPLDLDRALMLNRHRFDNRGRLVPEEVIRMQYDALVETKDWTP